MFVLNCRMKLSMVTSSSYLFRFQRLRCQIVCLELVIESVYGDLFVRPLLKGSKVKERSNYQLFWFQRLRCQIVHLELVIESVYGDLFIGSFLLGGQRSKRGQIINFVRFQMLRSQIVCLELVIESIYGDLFAGPFLKGSMVKGRSNYQLCPISKVEVSNCAS